jgi:hypothetical protein
MGNCTIVVCPARFVEPRAAIRVCQERALSATRPRRPTPESSRRQLQISAPCTGAESFARDVGILCFNSRPRKIQNIVVRM